MLIKFNNPQNQDFFDYWQSLPRDGLVPESKDFFPEDIPELLPFFTIYELVSTDCVRFKLAGTMISTRDGVDRTGDNYLDDVAPERRKKASEAFWAIYNQPCGMRVVLDLKKESGLVHQIEGLGLPMINSKGQYPLLYYSNHILLQAKVQMETLGDRLELITVRQRDFIDIGAGIPDFRD